jgi:hypothetical protein
MNDHDSEIEIERNLSIVREVSEALAELPILARLEFAKNVMLNRDGDKGMLPLDPVSAIVTEVLNGVIDVLKKHPQAAKLRTLDP